MIRFERVTFSYSGAPVIEDLSLDIPAGRCTVLVGESGAGKTTALRLINRLIEPSAGRVLFNGRDIAGMDKVALRRRMGYVVQSVGLIPHMTAAENVSLVPRLLGWPRERREAAAREKLSAVRLDLSVHGRRYPRQLSGGQQQRVGIARALAAEPEILLMDEPFGALDPLLREGMQEEFSGIFSGLGKTILLVTHDMMEAALLADRIVVLRKGRIAQEGPPEDIALRPADGYVAGLLGRRSEHIRELVRSRR